MHFSTNFGVIQLKTDDQQNIIGRSRFAPRRHAAPAPLGVRARAPPEATFARGHPPSQAAQLPRPPAPCDAQESTPAPRAGVPPALCPRPPALLRRTTAGASPHRHHRLSTRPIKGAIASPWASTELPVAIAALAPSSTVHKCPEPSNHLFPLP
jgi:hypothetical protein